MQEIILVIVLVLALALCVVILMQRSDGGAAALTGGSGGMGGFMNARGAGNFLTTTTSWLAGAFMLGCIILTGLTGGRSESESVIDRIDVDASEPVEQSAPSVPFSE
jgi:preprotein translocase subunit SecG